MLPKDYLKAMLLSYSNQEGGVTIAHDQLDQIVEIPLGFQPLGISNQIGESNDEILIVAYFEPAICCANVRRDDQGIHFAIDWIRGVNHGIQSVRLFPNICQASGANRAQCVVHGFEGTIWVSRNNERDFYVLSRPNKPNDRWTIKAKLPLPTNGDMKMLHATEIRNNQLVTMESRADLTEDWQQCNYSFSTTGDIKVNGIQPIPDWTYGIGFRRNDIMPWSITDFRSLIPHGIYYGDKLIVPEVCGTGITFLSDGSALVTRYGQSYPGCFNGIPGALIYVPAIMFNI